MKTARVIKVVAVSLSLALFAAMAAAQPDASLISGLRWRMIGPFRGGRSIAVSGIEGQPNTYYFGAVGGGVWKTTNGGETWEPLFDHQPISSIGALAIAPSNPDVIYVGTGEADLRSNLTYGDGVYKSSDGGRTWSNIGLRDSQHIARILIDPKNPDVALVAALGHAYGPNAERGVFRTTDGGRSWQKVLYKDENTGAIDLAWDPDNPQTIFAALWSVRRPPWSVYPPINGSGAIYRSSDGGITWNPVTGNGLPAGDWGRVGLSMARGTHGQRIYALIDTAQGGLFRSDDGGQSWHLTGTDERIRGRLWYFGEVVTDPKDPNTVYLPNVSMYRSTDSGRTFDAFKGAPGGDDYHALWIDPSNPRRMIFGSDQGVGISVDGGQTWTSWYNQPTAQFYHVAVDNQFPYHVYGAQQDSGTAVTTSRSDYGSITFRDWHSIGAGESGYIAPDPLDPNIVYGGGTYGELVRFDQRTGQAQVIAPEPARVFGDASPERMRFTWTSPLVFSPQDPHVLYLGSQFVMRSNNRGMSWEKISPDLTGAASGASPDGPLTPANATARGHGGVYTIAPSPVTSGLIWSGTDNGRIHLTRDGGKSWIAVTPAEITDWSKISLLEASHFDAATAYVAVDRHRLDDLSPYIYRTRDFGKTWKNISNGIPPGAYVRAVREDPVRKGLLFAGTELGVFFSLDDGERWQPLQLNLPVTPVHDLVIKDKDLVIATHGRSFWILDDITPLRQLTHDLAAEPVHLFAPSTAIRIRASVNHDTPLPPEVPAGENPPAGAVLYYYLKSPAQEVRLEVLDAAGKLVRQYSSRDQKPFSPPAVPFPAYWFRPPLPLVAEAGMHRFVWDLRYTAPSVPQHGYSMATVFGQNVPSEPEGPQALPGSYTLRLTVDGKSYTQPLKLIMDPRVPTSPRDLEKQFALETRISQALGQANQALAEIHDFYARNKENSGAAEKLKALAEIEPAPGQRDHRSAPDISGLSGTLAQLLTAVDSADTAPTAAENAAAEKAFSQLQPLLNKWNDLKK
ncbi:MAG TPA: hypothetical protein VFK06_03935 [Candidatus Angelobacter sp.]|nr:hypothetical protein [Candidatus Angelobacter sp.]